MWDLVHTTCKIHTTCRIPITVLPSYLYTVNVYKSADSKYRAIRDKAAATFAAALEKAATEMKERQEPDALDEPQEVARKVEEALFTKFGALI